MMDKNEKLSAPLSSLAKSKNGQNGSFLMMPIMISTVSLILCCYSIDLLLKSSTAQAFVTGLAVVNVIVWCAVLYFWWKERKAILAKNAADYKQSVKLHAALQKFSGKSAAVYPLPEKNVSGDGWVPFRVEHFLSESLRANFSGIISGSAGFFGFHGTISGDIKGVTVPNLLDSSTVIFLEKGNETLRVLVPSPRATREMLSRAIEGWSRQLKEGSHLRKVLHDFVIDDTQLCASITHPQLIDKLDLGSRAALAERPVVHVIGEVVYPGVALATALEVGGEGAVFLPSGFFQALSGEVASLIGEATAPKMLESVASK